MGKKRTGNIKSVKDRTGQEEKQVEGRTSQDRPARQTR